MIQLSAENLSLRYDDQEVIHQLSLSIPTQKVTCLIGPNGSGKSTLLKGLARLLKPCHGAAYLDGHAIHQLNTREVARKVSVLVQLNDAPAGMSVRELLAFGRYPHRSLLGFLGQGDDRAIETAMEVVGIAHLADRAIGELSGGQRQLAWIAMTLAQETEIMLLDEPTTFLDLPHQLQVLTVLSRLQRDHNQTIVLVLHDINLAARFSHHMVALREGEIVFQGTPIEVITPQMLSEVFGVEAIVKVDEVSRSPYCIALRAL